MAFNLDRSAVHLWVADVSKIGPSNLLPDEMHALSPEEFARADAFRAENDRSRFLYSRLLLRRLLTRYEPSIEPSTWRFATTENGKPYIVEPVPDAPLSFNISHSGDSLAIAIGRQPALGVDVEACDPKRASMKVAQRYFHGDESELLGRLPEHEFVERFYELWTLKEAYAKARGLALPTPLGQLRLDLTRERGIAFDLIGEAEEKGDCGLRFWLLSDSGFRFALALETDADEVALKTFGVLGYPASQLSVTRQSK